MRIVAVTNQKGGSGKTTTAVNLAAALAEAEQNVLLIDLDPQASASAWCGVTPAEGRGLFDVFAGEKVSLSDLAHLTDKGDLQVIPASPWLVNVEKAVAGKPRAEIRLRNAHHIGQPSPTRAANLIGGRPIGS